MRKQTNKTPQKNLQPPITETTDTEGDKVPEKDYKKFIIKMINEVKEDLRNEMRENTGCEDHFNIKKKTPENEKKQ